MRKNKPKQIIKPNFWSDLTCRKFYVDEYQSFQYRFVMQNENSKKLIDLLIKNNGVGFFDPPITLKSGKKSSWYVNWRRITDFVESSLMLADIIAKKSIEIDKNINAICGVPEGATKTAVIATIKLHEFKKASSTPLLVGRSKPKEHGNPADKFFIGPTNGNFVVLEDVVTSGGSMLEFIPKLKEAGGNIIAVISLTDRQGKSTRKKLTQKLLEQNIKYVPLLTAVEIIPKAIEVLNPSDYLKKLVEIELKELEGQ